MRRRHGTPLPSHQSHASATNKSRRSKLRVRVLICLCILVFLGLIMEPQKAFLQFAALSQDAPVFEENKDHSTTAKEPTFVDSKQKGSVATTTTTPVLTKLGPHYTSLVVKEKHCAMTVVLMDPTISQATLWALASVAANAHPANQVCILIQTSQCRLESERNVTPVEAYDLLTRQIAQQAPAPLDQWIQQGQVRVSILNHTRYSLKACDNFYSPSNAWMNHGYWGSVEFDEQDSDLVLMIQGDAVLCHGLDVEAWKEFAYVGAPWPPKRQRDKAGWAMCSILPRQWHNWHKKAGEQAPAYPTEDDICTRAEKAAVGNGGLSLRSRYWMQKSIEYCPHQTLSGLSVPQIQNAKCTVSIMAQEDSYFGTILRGLADNPQLVAPNKPPILPKAYEAALFASEMRYPVDFEHHYYSNTSKQVLEDMAARLFHSTATESGLQRYQRLRKAESKDKPLLSVGLHKPWQYRKQAYRNAAYRQYLQAECPFVLKMIPEKYNLK